MPNLWKQFEALLPYTPMLLGRVATSHGDGTVTVALLGGGALRVTFDGDDDTLVGRRVFLRDGQVTGEAPDLPSYDIEI